jgi:hypothetical protein
MMIGFHLCLSPGVTAAELGKVSFFSQHRLNDYGCSVIYSKNLCWTPLIMSLSERGAAFAVALVVKEH